MKKLICATVVWGFASLLFGQNDFAQRAHDSSALQSLVDIERAFSKTSEEKGIRPAFMAFIADAGILFRPTAVKGKQWMLEHPLPASQKRPWLSWQPIFADVAGAGDMGYTTGPWQYKDDIHDAKPAAFGDFVTIWQRQADGSWKFAIDLGISHPEPSEAAVPWQLPRNYKESPRGRTVNIEGERAALLLNERGFFSPTSRDALRFFQSYAAKNVRVYREGKFPFVGKTAAAAALSMRPSVWTCQPVFADVSSSGDLGYTYGTYRLKSKDPSTPDETGNYLRIWKKQSGAWKIVLDVANPLPPEAKGIRRGQP